jgi:hypothetical protein
MATVICRYPNGSERIVDSGVSLEHAKRMARHYAEPEGGESGCGWFASEKVRSPVKVPRHVLGGIEAVRSSGECNMFDVSWVREVAHRGGY